jgi:hypothetical protein
MNSFFPGIPGGLFDYSPTGTSRTPSSGDGDDMASFLTGLGQGGWGQYQISIACRSEFSMGGSSRQLAVTDKPP